MDRGLQPSSGRLPAEITANLNPAMPLRPYQREALWRLIRQLETPAAQPRQLLFHMATGSGKTLIMAAAMLHLYRLGYRRFLFFVNSSNIIEKTRDNFLNERSAKYLFARDLFIGQRRIRIQADDTFRSGGEDELTIIFTTIQGLHSRLNHPRENSLHDNDFERHKTVFLSDEAHHINAETKKGALSRQENNALLSWENSVNRIFRAHPQNILLEFTATADLNHPAIRAKYRDKLVFDYSLARFRQDGYSKEVRVLQSDLPPFERALQALLLSLYRQKMFERHGLSIKPVVLLKSKTIADSRRFATDFARRLQRLERDDLEPLEAAGRQTVTGRVLAFFRRRPHWPEELIAELQTAFGPGRCISVDSKNDSEQKQLLINSLEEPDNPYRVVFAVDKLNEGWDVLNLFDIVRLYDTRAGRSGGSRPARTTLSEAQLIGRGARYCPFRTEEDQPADRRKFDDRPEHPLRMGELLYYHASHNPAYIAGLNRALRDIGMRDARETQRKIYADGAFTGHEFYKKGVLFLNRRVRQETADILPGICRERVFEYSLGETAREESLFDPKEAENRPAAVRELSLDALGAAVLRKALNRVPFFHFRTLRKTLPGLDSISTFISAPEYLGGVRLRLRGAPERLRRLPARDALRVAQQVLWELAADMQDQRYRFSGSETFHPRPLSEMLPLPAMPDKWPENPGPVWAETPLPNAGRSFMQAYRRLHPRIIKTGATPFLVTGRRIRLYRFEDGAVFRPDFVLFIRKNPRTLRQIFIACGPEVSAADREFLTRLKHSIREGDTVCHIAGIVFGEGIAESDRAWDALIREISRQDKG